jgi:hypothetical protein
MLAYYPGTAPERRASLFYAMFVTESKQFCFILSQPSSLLLRSLSGPALLAIGLFSPFLYNSSLQLYSLLQGSAGDIAIQKKESICSQLSHKKNLWRRSRRLLPGCYACEWCFSLNYVC